MFYLQCLPSATGCGSVAVKNLFSWSIFIFSAQALPAGDRGCRHQRSRCILGRGSRRTSAAGDETNLDKSADGEQGGGGDTRAADADEPTSDFGE